MSKWDVTDKPKKIINSIKRCKANTQLSTYEEKEQIVDETIYEELNIKERVEKAKNIND